MTEDFWATIDWFHSSEWNDDPSKADPSLVVHMSQIRTDTLVLSPPEGIPIYIHECWSQDGHSSKSYHYTGQAVDFHFGPGLLPIEEFILLVTYPGFGGIGYYPNWSPRPGWHVDQRLYSKSGRLYWVRRNGKYLYSLSELAEELLRQSQVIK